MPPEAGWRKRPRIVSRLMGVMDLLERAEADGDSPMAYKKPQLVARLSAMTQIEALEAALAVHAATCQEQHLRTILRLRVDNQRLEAQREFTSTGNH